MRSCAKCGRAYAEVVGAQEQRCPHCAYVERTPAAAAPARGARADPMGAAVEALRLWVRHPFALLVLWLPAFVAQAVALFAIEAFRQSAGLPLDPFAMTDEQRLRFLGVALPATVVAFAFELSLWPVLAAWVAKKRGQEGALATTGRRVGAIFALGSLLTVMFAAGALLFVVPFFIFLHWFLFAPAALVEGRSVGESLEASRAFARERRTAGFTALVVLAWVVILALELLLAGGFVSFLELFGTPHDYAVALAPALAAWPLAPLLPLFPAAFWSLAREAKSQAAASVAPDARPAERFRTTKCPQCATLIPYTATGQPVDVTCPVCGRAGRVL